MRTLAGLNLASGVCLIAFGTQAQFPIRDFPAVAMILMGVLALLTGVVGLFGSNRWRCCLTAFLGMHGLNLILEIVLCLCLCEF